MKQALFGVCAAFLIVSSSACGSPANVAGSYAVNLTNKDNGCQFANWTVGAMTSNVPITITQAGGEVTANVTGVAGTYLTVVLGSASFTGTIDGSSLSLKLFGTRSATKENCAYTINASLDAASSGDLIEGKINYESATNGSPDCGALQGCVTSQAFNGTRPPQ